MVEDGVVAAEVQPEAQPGKWKQLLGSRKFWAAVVGLGLMLVKTNWPDLPLGEEEVTGVVFVVVAYIMGTALEDAGRAANG